MSNTQCGWLIGKGGSGIQNIEVCEESYHAHVVVVEWGVEVVVFSWSEFFIPG